MADFLFFLLLPLFVAVALIDLSTMGKGKREALRVQALHRSGFSQRAISAQLGISRHRVKACLS